MRKEDCQSQACGGPGNARREPSLYSLPTAAAAAIMAACFLWEAPPPFNRPPAPHWDHFRPRSKRLR